MKSAGLEFRNPKMLLGVFGTCGYCGDVGDNRDHVMPIAFIGGLSKQGRYGIGAQVWSCGRCNGMLSNRIFNSFEERSLWVSNRYSELRERFGSPWNAEELEGIDWSLRKFILSRMDVDLAFKQASNWFASGAYYSNLEQVLYEPFLDKHHSKFKESYYEFFRTTILNTKQHFADRERTGASRSWNT